MVLLIDTNIVLDVLAKRDGFYEDSSYIWKLCETGQVHGYISALTFANLVYILRKSLTPERIQEVYKLLSLIFDIADVTASDVEHAAASQWGDFEDALQNAAAERLHANYIVTRNVRDYQGSRLTAFTPTELRARL